MTRYEDVFKFFLNPCSGNSTTGPIAVTRSTKNTCFIGCPLMNHGCYAESGHPRRAWDLVSKTGVNFRTFLRQIRALRANSLLRLSEAGDLPGDGQKGLLIKEMCISLAKACRKTKAWTYTHYVPNEHNVPILHEMNRYIAVNLSANDMETADKYFEQGFDVCLSVPKDFKMIGNFSPNGIQLVPCPEKLGKTDNCMTCGNGNPLCARKNRNYIILFPAHKAVRMIADVFNGKRRVRNNPSPTE